MDVLALPGSTRLSRSSGHRRCARCGKVVARRAFMCRRCGKQQRVNPRTVALLVTGLFLIGLFAVATAGVRLPFARLRGEAPVAPSRPVPPAARAVGVVTAAELWAAYEANPAEADARWKGKSIAITGTVVDVRRDYRGKFLLRLKTGDTLTTVRATVVSDDDSSSPLAVRGDVVSLRCTGRGAIIGSPELEACRPL